MNSWLGKRITSSKPAGASEFNAGLSLTNLVRPCLKYKVKEVGTAAHALIPTSLQPIGTEFQANQSCTVQPCLI